MQPGENVNKPSSTPQAETAKQPDQSQSGANFSERQAELVAALALAAFSIYLMFESAKLPIGYSDSEIGAGTFPFWVSFGMLGCCVWIVINWFRRNTPIAKSTVPYMERQAFIRFRSNAGLLTATLFSIHWIGMYGAVLLFLITYLRFISCRSWRLTICFALITPVVMFFFFEIMLKIILPKGYTEPLFYPLYQIFY